MTERTCSAEGCDRTKIFSRGMCSMHYQRWKKSADPAALRPRATKPDPVCSVDGCDRPTKARSWCGMHYDRWQDTGTPGEAGTRKRKRTGVCSVDGCDRPEQARGECSKHYARQRRTGQYEQGTRKLVPRAGSCSVDGCDRSVTGRGFCQLHYLRVRRTGDPGPVYLLNKTGGRRGSGYVTDQGYRKLSIKGREVWEHRYVMEQVLGRLLLPGEVVHHKNGRRADNRPENLELWVKPQPAGQRVQDLVDWVVETYPQYVEASVKGHPQLFMH